MLWLLTACCSQKCSQNKSTYPKKLCNKSKYYHCSSLCCWNGFTPQRENGNWKEKGRDHEKKTPAYIIQKSKNGEKRRGWMKMSCLLQRTVALQKSLSLEERLVRESLFPSVCMVPEIWKNWHEWDSQWVKVISSPWLVNWKVSTDAAHRYKFKGIKFFCNFWPCCFVLCFFHCYCLWCPLPPKKSTLSHGRLKKKE